MQVMNGKRLAILGIFAVVAALLLAEIAHVMRMVFVFDFRYHTFLHAVSPDGKLSVQIRERCGVADCAVDIVLDSANTKTRLIELDDCSSRFAHIAWADDSEAVSVYLNTTYCGETWVNFDVNGRRFLTFDGSARRRLEQSIQRRYASKVDPDHVLNWMRTAAAEEIFRTTARMRD